MGQGQPKVIIWTTLVVLPYTMLHTKFQGHGSIGSGEEDFLRCYHIWAWQPCWSCDPDHLNNFSFLQALEAVYKICCNRPSSFRGEVVWNCGRTTDGRTTEPAYTISSPGAFGSGELQSLRWLSHIWYAPSLEHWLLIYATMPRNMAQGRGWRSIYRLVGWLFWV